ncbi:T9SS type A sorting domain-containing protein [Gelidibacter maritimus]|uniref:T9SS type A sorting domain-containing protein n=1 Tax=Gelidibacter maritimus TaxID=2761487 RepID=A0A7W2M664_9FLAO|nr:T9SS type A sorting domain-containing protein [Gelidibacter maritimus]MBA6153429.1 T9SS type A sorting domain-containing protein [Gelidibacter maritimus]
MKPILTLSLVCAMALPVSGQVIAAFSGTKVPEAVTVPNISAEPLSRGPGLTVSGGPTFNSGNWTSDKSIDTRDYIEWSVTADPGYTVDITELQINFDRDPDGFSHFFTGNGPARIRIRTSLDDFKSDIYAHDKVSNSGQSPTIETALKSAPGASIIFRLYGFAANIGMLGPLGTLDIEGGLGTVLGLENTGIRLSGKITYDGLQFNNGTWTPYAPSAKTGDKNIIIGNGVYTEANAVQVKNVKVNPGAGILIQKTGSLTVNGNLFTANKVTLESGSDAFASLIVSGEVAGTVTYKRQMKTKTLLSGSGNELLISAPVTGETFESFRKANPNIVSNTANSQFQFGPFNKTKAAFDKYSKKDKPILKAATGYRAAATDNGSFIFNGNVNTGEVHKTMSHSGPALAAWNLLGNPYPSYLKLSDFLLANSEQLAPESVGIYSFNGDATRGWQVYNQAYLTLYPQAKLPPGQGFMVAAKKDGDTITFEPGMRTIGKTSEFLVDKPIIKNNVGYLKLDMTSGIRNYSTEVYFNDHSTKGLDPGYDASIYGGKAPDFSIASQLVEDHTDLDMAVQSLAYTDLDEGVIIPLVVKATKDQALTIQMKGSRLPEEVDVYLEDKQQGTFTLLNLSDYQLDPNANLSNSGRFYLHIVNTTLTYGSHGLNELLIATSNASHILQIKQVLKPDTNITLYDLQGRALIQRQLNEQIKNNTLDLSKLSKGIYILKLRSGAMEKIKKIFVY